MRYLSTTGPQWPSQQDPERRASSTEGSTAFQLYFCEHITRQRPCKRWKEHDNLGYKTWFAFPGGCLAQPARLWNNSSLSVVLQLPTFNQVIPVLGLMMFFCSSGDRCGFSDLPTCMHFCTLHPKSWRVLKCFSISCISELRVLQFPRQLLLCS